MAHTDQHDDVYKHVEVSAVDQTSTELNTGQSIGIVARPDDVDNEEKKSRPWLKTALAVAGLGLFVYLVLSSGITLDKLSRLGWGEFWLFLAISFGAIAADTLAWHRTLRHVGQPSLSRILGLRLGGDALTNGLPGGIVLGEPFKALMLKRWFGISFTDSAASQMTVKFGLGITQSLFVLAGLILIYPLLRERSEELFGFAGAQYLGLVVIIGFLGMLTVLLVAVFRGRSFSLAARGLARLPFVSLRRLLDRHAGSIASMDQSCGRIFSENRRQLPSVFGLLLAGWLASGLESYVLLRALDQPVSLQTAFALESVGSMFRLLFFLVPSGIGGQDASLLALFKLFKLPKAAGGAFVLLKRFKELIWIGVGLVLVMAFRDKRLKHMTYKRELGRAAREAIAP